MHWGLTIRSSRRTPACGLRARLTSNVRLQEYQPTHPERCSFVALPSQAAPGLCRAARPAAGSAPLRSCHAAEQARAAVGGVGHFTHCGAKCLCQGLPGLPVRWRAAHQWVSCAVHEPCFRWRAAHRGAACAPHTPSRRSSGPVVFANAVRWGSSSSIVRMHNTRLLAHTGRSAREPRFPARPRGLRTMLQPNHSLKPTCSGLRPPQAA
jgi:hypothetical protein